MKGSKRKISGPLLNRLFTISLFYRTDRYCKETTIINGVTIPKGATIVVPIVLLHYSPLYWKDPEKFDPGRLANCHGDIKFHGHATAILHKMWDCLFLPFVWLDLPEHIGMVPPLYIIRLNLGSVIYNKTVS